MIKQKDMSVTWWTFEKFDKDLRKILRAVIYKFSPVPAECNHIRIFVQPGTNHLPVHYMTKGKSSKITKSLSSR